MVDSVDGPKGQVVVPILQLTLNIMLMPQIHQHRTIKIKLRLHLGLSLLQLVELGLVTFLYQLVLVEMGITHQMGIQKNLMSLTQR